MHIVRNLADVRHLAEAGHIPADMGRFLARKVEALRQAVEPETSAEAFRLETHGKIGIVEAGDRSLAALGLPERLDELWPEWVSRLELASGRNFLAYFVADNDHVPIAVVPESVASEAILAWLAEQPMEAEHDAEGGAADGLPEPF